MDLLKDERVDDLQINGLKLIQNEKKYCFTTDAVLLADFVRVKKGDVLLDLCSGSGIIPVLVLGKSKRVKACYAVEIQEYFSALIQRNALLNRLDVQVLNCSVQDSVKQLQNKRISVITVNPPYGKIGSGILSQNSSIERHEVLLTLQELIFSAGKILQTGGKFYIVHQCSRLGEIMFELQKNGFAPKTMRLIKAKAHLSPHLVLIESVKDGGEGLTVLPDLVIQNKDGSETPEIQKIYQRNSKDVIYRTNADRESIGHDN